MIRVRKTPVRALWVCGELLVPPHSGGSIYSLGLIEATARFGIEVVVIGVRHGNGLLRPFAEWHLLQSTHRSSWRSALSPLPVMAARLPLTPLREKLRSLLVQNWDTAVVNHLSAVWALQDLQAARSAGKVGEIWYASQNDEVDVWRRALSETGYGISRRLGRGLDLVKVAAAQRRLLKAAAFVSAITPEDAERFRRKGAREVAVARPGLPGQVDGPVAPASERPRSVVLAGSFVWQLKLHNLEDFLRAAADRLRKSGVAAVVVGRMAPEVVDRLRVQYPWADVRGEVEDLRSIYRESRMAIIPETRGGGFKLKSLEIVEMGIAIAAIPSAMTGLPLRPQEHYVAALGCRELVEHVLAVIDDGPYLDAIAESAYAVCSGVFDWATSGRMFASRMTGMR